MNVKEKYTSPEILVSEIKESIMELDPSGIDNVSVKSLFSSQRKDLFDSGAAGGWTVDYL